MAKNTKHCIICGTEYNYCPNCGSSDTYPRWMYAFHSENCVNVWAVINDYKTGVLTKEQAKDELKSLDLSKKDSFAIKYKTVIDEIMGGTPEPVPTKKMYNNSESKYESSKKSYKK